MIYLIMGIVILGGLLALVFSLYIKKSNQVKNLKSTLELEKEWKIKASYTLKKLQQMKEKEDKNVQKIIDSPDDSINNQLNELLQGLS